MDSARLLIVDDEPQIRRVLLSALVAQGYEVQTARTGEDALEVLRKADVDLVLLDVNMPGMGGLEACREIRAGWDMAIIMLTVRSDESDKVAALDAGADDYVTKPFGMPELCARIRAHLRRIEVMPGGQRFESGDFELDLASRHLTIHGKDVRLTPKEFQLLQFFVANPNVTLSHARLLQAVWGPDYGQETEYLHVFINQLRKKLEPDPSKPRYIITEPWQGYRFSIPQ
jgi:two-component system KDP operon response regulator KdpE